MAGTGDFTGSGISDILFQNSGGTVADWLMKNGTVSGASLVGTARQRDPGAGATIAASRFSLRGCVRFEGLTAKICLQGCISETQSNNRKRGTAAFAVRNAPAPPSPWCPR